MEIYEAIRGRRTIKNFKPDAVTAETLTRVLEAAIWAQNHRLTQPWRLKIPGPQTREALAEAHELARHKIMNQPALVVVSYVLSADPEMRREDYAAVACAVQNIALAAWGEGLGMLWSTGKHTRDPKTYPLLGINPEQEEIAGFLSFGYPADIPSAPPRKPLGEVLELMP